ncbi:hypothetical protein E2320_014139 [Naja naja]|nr:hypothetical protein E2320_014139 [Naja naja]
MFEQLRGPEEEEEEEEMTGPPSTQTGDPPLARRDPAWQNGGDGCLGSCRTLCHPSFQPFYSAILGCCSSWHPPPEGPATLAPPGPQQLLLHGLHPALWIPDLQLALLLFPGGPPSAASGHPGPHHGPLGDPSHSQPLHQEMLGLQPGAASRLCPSGAASSSSTRRTPS